MLPVAQHARMLGCAAVLPHAAQEHKHCTVPSHRIAGRLRAHPAHARLPEGWPAFGRPCDRHPGPPLGMRCTSIDATAATAAHFASWPPTAQPTTTALRNLQTLHARVCLQPVDISAEFICRKKETKSSFMSLQRVVSAAGRLQCELEANQPGVGKNGRPGGVRQRGALWKMSRLGGSPKCARFGRAFDLACWRFLCVTTACSEHDGRAAASLGWLGFLGWQAGLLVQAAAQWPPSAQAGGDHRRRHRGPHRGKGSAGRWL